MKILFPMLLICSLRKARQADPGMKAPDWGLQFRMVPIIAMSANAFAEDIINSRLAGMNVHLAKPLDAEKMIVALKQCMADNSDVKLHEDL